MNPITLRPYQDECIDGIREHFRALAKRVILCAPTGAGKTVMFSSLVQQTLNKSLDAKVLILTNRVELLTQAGGTLEAFGIRFEAITAKNKHINRRARCFVGMVETYWNRLDKHPWLLDMTLVIIDECHYGNFKKLFARFKPETFVIGATATPIAAAKNDPLSNYYQALVNKVQIPELVEQGFLSPCVTIAPEIDRSGLKLDSKGEYSEQSQMDTFAKRSVYDGVLSEYRAICDRYNQGFPLKAIVFNVNVAHSLEVTQIFNDAGIPCRHVDGMTPDAERNSIISGYKSGAFPVICNVGILNAGFDDATTRMVIFNRATTSVSLWLQSLGRGSRIAPGKDRFFALDMGDNWFGGKLGLWDAVRQWEELWNVVKKKSDKVGVAPMKPCPDCKALIPLMVKTCSHCGYVYPEKEREYATADKFVEVTADMVPEPKFSPEETRELMLLDRASKWGTLDVETLEKLREYRGRKSGWPIHVIREASQTEEEFRDKIKELARLRGYRSGWANHQEWRPAQLQTA